MKFVCGKINLFKLNWRILEERACGPPNIDLAILKKYTYNEVSLTNKLPDSRDLWMRK